MFCQVIGYYHCDICSSYTPRLFEAWQVHNEGSLCCFLKYGPGGSWTHYLSNSEAAFLVISPIAI